MNVIVAEKEQLEDHTPRGAFCRVRGVGERGGKRRVVEAEVD